MTIKLKLLMITLLFSLSACATLGSSQAKRRCECGVKEKVTWVRDNNHGESLNRAAVQDFTNLARYALAAGDFNACNAYLHQASKLQKGAGNC